MDERKPAAELVGFVFEVKMGGSETCNCRAEEVGLRDTHIELVAGPTDSGAKRG